MTEAAIGEAKVIRQAVVVVGGTSGVGRAGARRFIAAGARAALGGLGSPKECGIPCFEAPAPH